MRRYIDADKLKAEIESREKIIRNSANQISDSEKKTYYSGCADALLELLPFVTSLQQEPRFPQYDNIVEKVFGAGNLEGWEFRDAEMLVALAKEELLKSLHQEQTPTEREIAEAHHYAEMIRERDKARIQQEQPDTKESNSHLEHWLAFFGCPEENIEKCATQIAQGYGAIRYLEGIRHGAEAVNELAQQEQPEVPSGEDVMVMCNQILIDWVKDGKTQEEKEQREQAHIRFFELYDDYLMKEQPEVELEKDIDAFFDKWDKNSNGCIFDENGTRVTIETIKGVVKHFLNARKEEK